MANSVLLGRGFKPSLFQPQVIAKRLRDACTAEGKAVIKQMDALVAPWQGDKPKFTMTQQVAGTRSRDIFVLVEPVGTTRALDKFNFLNGGTSIRWYGMSRDFKRKSHPRSIRVNAGNTGKPYKLAQPVPGLKPRSWVRIVVRRRTPEFHRKLRDIISQGVSVSARAKQP